MSPKKPALPFDGYVRVSSVAGREGESFISPDVQRDTIRRLAAAHGIELGEIVQELNVSGKKKAEARELGRLIAKVENGESGGLLVWKVSRFSRSLLDGVLAADRVRKAGGRIIGDDLDSGAPMGRAMLGFLLGWAEEELDARRIGWHEAKQRAAARGVHPTRTPVGYKRAAVHAKTGKPSGALVPDPDVAPAVAECFRLRAQGASLQECADVLAEATGKGWSRSTLGQMFTSQTYLGRIALGDGIYEDDAHPAIVDTRTWTLAQRPGRRPRHDGSLASQGVLAGLIRCAGCGHQLSVTASGPQGARVASYTCRGKRASGHCPAPASAVVDKVDALVRPILDKHAAEHDATFADYMAAVDASAAAYELASQELDDFLAAALVSQLGPELYGREVARRRDAVEVARERWEADERRGAALLASRETSGLEHDRAVAQTLLENITLRKSENGRWDKVEDRVSLVWRVR